MKADLALHSDGMQLAGLIFQTCVRTSFHFVSFLAFSFKYLEKAKKKGKKDA